MANNSINKNKKTATRGAAKNPAGDARRSGARQGTPSGARQSMLTGRNPVLEALKAGRPINKVYLQNHITGGVPRAIESLARERGIPVVRVEKAWLDKISRGVHQGTAASASVKGYSEIHDIMEFAVERQDSPLIIVANEIHDPYNLGAIIRSAEAAGAHGVIIPKRNSAGLVESVAKASAGAIEYMRIARITNVATTLSELKKQGLWIVGADSSGDISYTECDMSGATAIVIGGEDKGLGRLVREACDTVVRLPMRGNIASLNASAAAAVMLYEALRQRSK